MFYLFKTRNRRLCLYFLFLAVKHDAIELKLTKSQPFLPQEEQKYVLKITDGQPILNFPE